MNEMKNLSRKSARPATIAKKNQKQTMSLRNYVKGRSQNHSNTNQFLVEIGCNVEVNNGRRY